MKKRISQQRLSKKLNPLQRSISRNPKRKWNNNKFGRKQRQTTEMDLFLWVISTQRWKPKMLLSSSKNGVVFSEQRLFRVQINRNGDKELPTYNLSKELRRYKIWFKSWRRRASKQRWDSQRVSDFLIFISKNGVI